MTVPSTIRSGVGFRHCQIFALDADGYPAAASTTVYEGLQISGARALTIDDPEPRQIVHLGDDAIFQQDVLPPDSPIGGELRVGKVNDTVDDLLSDDASFQVGEAKMFGFGTDSRGDENQVAILAYRQTLDTDSNSSHFGKRRWEGRLFPKAYLLSRESGFEDTPEERAFSVRPLFVTQHLWGEAFAAGTEGFERAQGIRIVSEYKPKVIAWKGDGVEVTFNFPTGTPAQSTDKVVIWDASVEQTTGFTVTVTQVVFSSAPTSGNIIVAFYEYQ